MWRRTFAASSGDEAGVRVFWSPQAEARAERIVMRLRAKNRGMAWRWTQAFLARTRSLYAPHDSGMPLLPTERRISAVVFMPVRIIFRVDRDRIVILVLRLARKPADDHQRDRDHHRK